MRIETQIQVGEAVNAGRAVAARWGSTRWAIPAGMVLGLVSILPGLIIGTVLARLLGLSEDLGTLLGLVFALAIYVLLGVPGWRRFATGRFKDRLAKHGVTGPIPTSYEIAPDTFNCTVGGVTRSARWEVVSEVFKARGWWVLIAQGEAFYVPQRVFLDVPQEREFIAGILGHLTDAARARSPDAVRMVA